MRYVFQYQEVAEPILTDYGEVITLDKWYAPWTQNFHRTLLPPIPYENLGDPPRSEEIFTDKWQVPWTQNFHRTRLPPIPYETPGDIPRSEEIFADKWQVAWTQNFHRPLLPPIAYETLDQLPPPVRMDTWYEAWTQNYHRALLPPIAYETRTPPPPEVQLEMWYQAFSLPRNYWDPPRQYYHNFDFQVYDFTTFSIRFPRDHLRRRPDESGDTLSERPNQGDFRT